MTSLAQLNPREMDLECESPQSFVCRHDQPVSNPDLLAFMKQHGAVAK